jgi:hypothetical protein
MCAHVQPLLPRSSSHQQGLFLCCFSPSPSDSTVLLLSACVLSCFSPPTFLLCGLCHIQHVLVLFLLGRVLRRLCFSACSDWSGVMTRAPLQEGLGPNLVASVQTLPWALHAPPERVSRADPRAKFKSCLGTGLEQDRQGWALGNRGRAGLGSVGGSVLVLPLGCENGCQAAEGDVLPCVLWEHW